MSLNYSITCHSNKISQISRRWSVPSRIALLLGCLEELIAQAQLAALGVHPAVILAVQLPAVGGGTS